MKKIIKKTEDTATGAIYLDPIDLSHLDNDGDFDNYDDAYDRGLRAGEHYHKKFIKEEVVPLLKETRDRLESIQKDSGLASLENSYCGEYESEELIKKITDFIDKLEAQTKG